MSERLQAEGQDLQLFRDECLGSGAYGVVCKAKLNELPCAAKFLHRVLFHPTIQRRFDQEHELLRSMRHPNVVQYLGIAHDPQSGLPILLMELLDGNLTDFLERSQEPLPYHVQVNLWHDIAIALTYLHSKHIIHRDLSGNNVLLIAGSRAKVSDFGMSMFTHVDVTKSRLTHCPGNANYMPPEALIESPTYSEKLDVFSSGVVALQIITRNYPNPSSSMKRHNDPKSPTGFSIVFVSEVERRKDDINLINPKHPMLPVILGCLSDRERDRPSARHLCHQLVTLKKAPEYTESLQQKLPQERVQEQEQQIREQEQQIQELQKQIDNEQQKQEQHHVVVQLQNDITIKERRVQVLEQQIQELQKRNDIEKQEQYHLIAVKERELQDLEQQITEQKLQNCEQERVVQQLVHTIREQQSSIQQMRTQITKLEKDVQVLNTRLHENSQELQSKKQELGRTRYNLQQKTEEFQHEREELQGQMQQADQGLQEFQRRLMEQLPPAFVERFTAEELPHHLKKLIEEGFQEWEDNLCKGDQLQEKEQEIQQQRQQILELQNQITATNEQLLTLQKQLSIKEEQLQKEALIAARQQIREFKQHLRFTSEHSEQLQEKEQEIQQQQQQMLELQNQITATNEQLLTLQKQLSTKDEQLADKHHQLQQKETVIAAHQQEIQELRKQLQSSVQHSQRQTFSLGMPKGSGGPSVSRMTSHKLQQAAVTPSQYTGLAEVDYHQAPYTSEYSTLANELEWKNTTSLQQLKSLPTSLVSHAVQAPLYRLPSTGAQPEQFIAALYQPEYTHDLCRPWKAVFTVCRKNTSSATALRKYHRSDFDEVFRPSAPVGFSFLEDAVELHIPFFEAQCQGYKIEVGVSPCMITMSDFDTPHPNCETSADDTYPPRIILEIEPPDMPNRRGLNCQLTLNGTTGPVRTFLLKSPRLRALLSADGRGTELQHAIAMPHEGILNSEPELNVLIEKIAVAIPQKWEEVGYALGIKSECMERIKYETKTLSNTMTSYREVFKYWFSHAEHRTWTAVLNALATEQVGEQLLARRIRHDLLNP